MNIVAFTWTLNAAHVIGQFCEHYSAVADRVLVVDGGSDDGTREIAMGFRKVELIDASHLQTPCPNDPAQVYTPEPHQHNIAVARARELGADWIIRDDSDCWPNPKLKRAARGIFETVAEPLVYVYRLYIWHTDRYFPKANDAGASLWAWRPDKVNVYGDEGDLQNTGVEIDEPARYPVYEIKRPMASLHYYCLTDEVVEAKMAHKEARREAQIHPLESIYAPPEPLPAWALEE